MFNGSDVVTMLFGIDGMRVRAQAEIVDEWWLKIETAPDVVGCTGCGTRAVGHGRRRVKVRDLPVFGRPVVLVWAKRIWRCPDPDCPRGVFAEQVPALVAARASITARAIRWAIGQLRREHATILGLSRQLQVAWAVLSHNLWVLARRPWACDRKAAAEAA